MLGKILNAFASSIGNTYTCPECGSELIFEDASEDSLVCENCGYSTNVDDYGLTDESYDSLYPTKTDVLTELGEYHGEDEPEINNEYYDPEIDGMYDDD